MVLRALPPWLLALTCLPRCLSQPCSWPPVLVTIPRCSGGGRRVSWQEQQCLCCGCPQLLACPPLRSSTAPSAPWHGCRGNIWQQQDLHVGNTSNLAGADCGEKELRAVRTWLSKHAVNCVPKVATALRLSDLKSSGTCKVFKNPLEILQSRLAKGRRKTSWKLISSFC